MAHGMPIGQSTRIVVTDEIQARRNIVVGMAGPSQANMTHFLLSWFWISAGKFQKNFKKEHSVPIDHFGRISNQFWLFHAWLLGKINVVCRSYILAISFIPNNRDQRTEKLVFADQAIQAIPILPLIFCSRK